MMISTSAMIAVHKAETEACNFMKCLCQPGSKVISTATLVEAQIGMVRWLPIGP